LTLIAENMIEGAKKRSIQESSEGR